MNGYFTIENCTAEQLDELRNSYFWADDTDAGELEALGIETPDDVPDWLLFQEYAHILFTDDDFWCTAGKT